MCVCLFVCLFVCPYVFQEKTIYIVAQQYIYSTYFRKKLYILLCNNIYSTYFRKKLYILLHNNTYVFQEKTIYIVLTGTVIYIVAKQLKPWQSVSLETSYWFWGLEATSVLETTSVKLLYKDYSLRYCLCLSLFMHSINPKQRGQKVTYIPYNFSLKTNIA
jgi:hypothetical protein